MKYYISDMLLFDDVRDLDYMFRVCNILFFNGEIQHVQLFYSTYLRRAAGICINACPVRIGISYALLYETTQYELINTLVHEMCHALVFYRGEDDGQRDGHGPLWSGIAYRINSYFGLRITRYHYEILPDQLYRMERESYENRGMMFLGRGKRLATAIAKIDLEPDVVVVDLDDLVVDLS